MYYISLEKSFHGASAPSCCIKIHAGMGEKLHIQDLSFILTGAPVYRVRNLKFATYLKFTTCENTNKIYELW